VIGTATIRGALAGIDVLGVRDGFEWIMRGNVEHVQGLSLDAETGRARVRLVDINSTRYAIARRYMIGLRRDDVEDAHELAKFAATRGLTLQDFRRTFEYLIANEPPPLELGPSPASTGD
jgi:hypothetical protein